MNSAARPFTLSLCRGVRRDCSADVTLQYCHQIFGNEVDEAIGDCGEKQRETHHGQQKHNNACGCNPGEYRGWRSMVVLVQVCQIVDWT